MSSNSFDAFLNFDQEILQIVVHETLPVPCGCRTSSDYRQVSLQNALWSSMNLCNESDYTFAMICTFLASPLF